LHTGFDVNGGFAEFVLGEARYVCPIPLGMDPVIAAPLMCAGVTVFKGLTQTEATPGDWIVISGIGGLGHLAVQYAKAMGYQVVAVDIDDSKLELAAKLGADLALNALNVNVETEVQQQIGGAHGVLVTAVSKVAFGQALGMVRSGGTVVLNGLPPGSFALDIYDIVMRALTLRGSIVGTNNDLARAVNLANHRDIKPVVTVANLEDVNDIFNKLETAPVTGRMVLDLRREGVCG
jgi:propanol-preferring alcohol dehydrogenase